MTVILARKFKYSFLSNAEFWVKNLEACDVACLHIYYSVRKPA